jgi:hypothetical protein
MKKQFDLFPTQTSTPQESPVSPSQSQDEKRVRKTLDTSGRTCLKLLNKKDPLIALSKTLLASSLWHSIHYYMNWKVKATPQGRLLFQLQASTPRTKENESGLLQSAWPTPRATKRMANYEGVSPSMAKGTHGWSLSAAVTDSLSDKPHKRWPTPRAAKGMWLKLTEGVARLQYKKYLESEVAYENINTKKRQPGGYLNSDWVEWLMGYGKGYTDLNDKDIKTLSSHSGFPDEPDVPRISYKKLSTRLDATQNQKDRISRLKSLGNSIVPQIAYNLGLAIIEDYDQNPPKK